MTSRAGRLVTRLIDTRSGETPVALLMFAYSFLAMTAYNILKPVTKSKLIDELGAVNLPPVLLASSIIEEAVAANKDDLLALSKTIQVHEKCLFFVRSNILGRNGEAN
jgi:hypothetical protein